MHTQEGKLLFELFNTKIQYLLFLKPECSVCMNDRLCCIPDKYRYQYFIAQTLKQSWNGSMEPLYFFFNGQSGKMANTMAARLRCGVGNGNCIELLLQLYLLPVVWGALLLSMRYKPNHASRRAAWTTHSALRVATAQCLPCRREEKYFLVY